MSAPILKVQADVKFKHLYICDTCGSSEAGDTVRISLTAYGADVLSDQLKSLTPRPSKMPVGWSSYHGVQRDEYRCKACTRG